MPFYRGRNILNWAIINGEKKFGVTVHYVDEGIDTGDIILQRFAPIERKDRYGDVLAKAQQMCADVLYEALIQLEEGKAERIPQASIHPVGFYCSGRSWGDEWIDWNWSSERIYNFVRGIAQPAPGARTFLNGKECIVDVAETIEDAPDYFDKPGSIVGKDGNSVTVKTGDSTLRVRRVLDAETGEEIPLKKLRIGTRFSAKVDRLGECDMQDKAVIVVGTGGHAKVLLDTLLERGVKVLGFLEKDNCLGGVDNLLGIPVLGTDDEILHYNREEVELVNGIGSVGVATLRRTVYDKFKAQGYSFRQVIHPSAVISPRAFLGEGVQVMAGAVVNIGTSVGENSIVNTRASIDHDCRIGAHVHIAPGCTLSGNVVVEEGCHIGTGASVIQGIHLGQKTVIGAGSLVIRDIPEGKTAFGIPARMQ